MAKLRSDGSQVNPAPSDMSQETQVAYGSA
jgi:hypothetical protein